jgi:drug/metabolite transporter (DMT)-like permease
VISHRGELAALGTALLWSITSVLFTLAGRRIPPTTLNLLRTGLAAIFLTSTLFLLTGHPWPQDAPPARVLDLVLSGLIGLALGDNFLFHGYQWIGPRLTSLLMTLVPPISATIAWVHLHERLDPPALLGMAMVLGGVAWVVAERHPEAATIAPSRHRALGVLCGIGGAMCQSVGAIFAKRGMTAIDPLPATLIRMVSAFAALAVVFLVLGKAPATPSRIRSRPALGLTLIASLLGPYLGVWFSLVALHYTKAGIALTLMAMSPIFVIPISRRVLGEHASRRAFAGAILAVTGVALLLRRG